MSGKTFFEQKWTDASGVEHDKTSFADVPVDESHDNAIDTREFLLAAKSLLTLFDVLGKVKFAMVVSDMSNNIDKVERRYNAAPSQSATLQDLVRNELKEKRHEASEGLLWLTRSLYFTSRAIRLNVDKPTDEMSTSFKASYSETLRKHHNMFTAGVVSSIFGFAPTRRAFYDKLAGIDAAAPAGPDSDALREAQLARVHEQLLPWLVALEKQVKILNDFMARKEAKW